MFDINTTQRILELILSLSLGMTLGLERTHRKKAAGLRTFSLVSLGSTLFTIISVEGSNLITFAGNYDPSRIASQIVVGIGFIGAGLIFFQRGEVQGLTTAASLWVAAAIGMAVGFGLYTLAIFTTFCAIIILWVLRVTVEPRIPRIKENNNEQ